MMTKMMTLCLGAMLVLGETLTAQIGPPPTEPMASITLEEAVRVALRRSPVLAQSDQAVGNAEEARRSAWGAFLPSLSTSSGASLRSMCFPSCHWASASPDSAPILYQSNAALGSASGSASERSARSLAAAPEPIFAALSYH